MDRSVLEEKSSFQMLGLSFPSKLNKGPYIVSIATTENWSFDSFGEVSFLLKLLSISTNLPYGLKWNTVVYVWAGAPSCYLGMLDKLQKRAALQINMIPLPVTMNRKIKKPPVK